jgi:hypothetical protein
MDEETYQILDEYLTEIENNWCPYLTLEGDYCIVRMSKIVYLWCKTEEHERCGWFKGRYRKFER